MFGDSYDEDGDPPLQPAELARRFRLVALAWLVGAAVLWAVGGLQLGFAIVVGVVGAVSALALAQYQR